MDQPRFRTSGRPSTGSTHDGVLEDRGYQTQAIAGVLAAFLMVGPGAKNVCPCAWDAHPRRLELARPDGTAARITPASCGQMSRTSGRRPRSAPRSSPTAGSVPILRSAPDDFRTMQGDAGLTRVSASRSTASSGDGAPAACPGGKTCRRGRRHDLRPLRRRRCPFCGAPNLHAGRSPRRAPCRADVLI